FAFAFVLHGDLVFVLREWENAGGQFPVNPKGPLFAGGKRTDVDAVGGCNWGRPGHASRRGPFVGDRLDGAAGGRGRRFPRNTDSWNRREGVAVFASSCQRAEAGAPNGGDR